MKNIWLKSVPNQKQCRLPSWRTHVDTLKGWEYPNMKELRLTAPDGEWRVAFAFNPLRHAILLIGDSKSGVSQRQFDHLTEGSHRSRRRKAKA